MASYTSGPLEKPYSLKEDKTFSYGTKKNNNLLINGDNLAALKALSDQFLKKIKCIYIDPPYDNGEKYHHYNDNLGQDQWLTMMEKQLKMLWPLLTEDGSLWISIDDSQVHYLKVLCDQLFGRDKFVTTFIWNQRKSRENRRVFSVNHEYILLYVKDAKKFSKVRNDFPLSEEVLKRYKNPDSDPRGAWQSVSLNVQGGHGTRSQHYVLNAPNGKQHILPAGRCWAYTDKKLQEEIQKNNIWFGKDGNSAPRIKKFLKDVKGGLTPHTLWLADEVGTSDSAKKDLKKLFHVNQLFETPKPEQLLERIIQIATQPGDFVLDSFLGSGTTAAVAHKLHRNWIGIELGSHCESYCFRRLKEVIDGSDTTGISKSVHWAGGGGFKYLKVEKNKKKSSPRTQPHQIPLQKDL